MCELLVQATPGWVCLAALGDILSSTWNVVLILIGFSVVVFFHELGHFAVAKWAGVRVEKFAVGFGPELFGVTRGETRYSFNILPLGGYVKMLGQEDFEIDKSGELAVSNDPRSFTNKPVGHRMAVVSAGVIMNLIVAAALFMVVYMVGREETAPIIGQVVAETPAARAGLQVGDRIVEINRTPVSSYDQVLTAVRLAEPLEPLEFKIQRDGQTITKFIVPQTTEMNFLQVGFAPGVTREIVAVSSQYATAAAPPPKPGDVVVEVNGRKIDESLQLYIWDLMLQGRNQPSTLIVERPDPSNPTAAPQRVAITVNKGISFLPNGTSATSPRDLLGLIPRVRVSEIDPDGPAGWAGLQDGDVIVRWGTEDHPTNGSIRESLLRHADQDIPVIVRRVGDILPQQLYFRAIVRQPPKGAPRPQPGCAFELCEQDKIVLAGVNPEASGRATPAATTDLSKGCRIEALDGETLSGWADLTERFREHAGQRVELTYAAPQSSEKRTTTMTIPPCLSTILNLPSYSGPFQRINFTLDGQTDIKVNLGEKTEHLPAHYHLAIRQYLQDHVGQDVQVSYKDDDGKMTAASVHITEDMIDPWYRRVTYSIPLMQTKEVTYVNRELNPLKAIWLGTMQTYYFVAKTYLTLKRLIFTRSVGVEHMSGPLGIIRIGAHIAGLSKIEMLYFLGLISANLAVINFLPLPIVDGGLMVFLIIEKIKGSPVSIRTQVMTQIIGIALFAAMFVLITFQDIANWVG